MATRQTIKVTELLDIANKMLAYSADNMTRERDGIAALLESALIAADAYAGFRYTGSDADDTQRQYYRHPKLH